MTSFASRRYAAALDRLETNDRDAYRAVLNRVDSYRSLAERWRAAAEGRPLPPTARQLKDELSRATHKLGLLEEELAKTRAQLAGFQHSNQKEG